MAEDEPPMDPHPPLVDSLLQYGKLGFNPELPEETRRPNQAKFNSLIESTGVLALMPALNLLIQPGRSEPWLRIPLIAALASLPLRSRGVQHTIEFVLSVHPSSAGFSATAKAGRGSGISHEALNAASKLLSAPPSSMSPEKWFSSIAPQLFTLLQGEGEPEMDKAAAFIIGFGILGRRQYGAPGLPGWKAFVEPMLRDIDPTIAAPNQGAETLVEEEIVSLGHQKILVPSTRVARSLQRLNALVTSHPHPSLTKRLLGPILLPLWSLSAWNQSNDYIEATYRRPARNLLRTLLQLSSSNSLPATRQDQPPPSNNVSVIAQNLMFRGRLDPLAWAYASANDGGIQVEERAPFPDGKSPMMDHDLTSIDIATSSFSRLLGSVPGLDAEISHLFINLCKKWLQDGEIKGPESIALLRPRGPTQNVENQLIEAKIMQEMMTSIPEKLVSDSQQLLDLVTQVLSKFEAEKASGVGNEDVAEVALSLLNIVLTSPSSMATPESKQTFDEIQRLLYSISKTTKLDISLTAQNLLSLIELRGALDEPNIPASDLHQDRRYEDRKNYSLAMSYLTSTESPPPVRVQGLELISSLIQSQSPVLDIPALSILFSSLLQDIDEYIYLRVIKSFIELSSKHPKAILKDLIDRYVDPNEESELDQRLRFGEALLQVIKNASHTFSGEIAKSVCEGLLSIAGRRGLRPKYEREQENRNLLERRKNKEAEDAWDGPPPQLDEYLGEEFEENEILSQIVSGWESKRGSEDVRIRASALSILGQAIEENIGGVGSGLISTSVDLSMHILTLEPEPGKGILRRSAILLIMSFIRALNFAREQGTKLGFGLVGKSLEDVQRILKYVEDTDNDDLVRQHSKDVTEGLEAWQFNALLRPETGQTEIQELAGLSITPGGGDNPNARTRPRIEEIE